MFVKDGVVVGVIFVVMIWVLVLIGVVIVINNLLVVIKLFVLVVGILYGVDVFEVKFKSLGCGVYVCVKCYLKLYYWKEKWS